MPAPIILVEDNDDEVVLLRRALTISGSTAPLVVVQDGLEAIAYLSGEGRYSNRLEHPYPQLMVLDLKLPRLSGLGVLKWIREQPGVRRLPVIVLTSSNEESDVVNAYDLGANSYLVKPTDLGTLQELAALVHRYWVGTNVRAPLQHEL